MRRRTTWLAPFERVGTKGGIFWQRKVWTHFEFQRHNGDHLRREKWKVRFFGKGKCKLIANFSAKWGRNFRLSLSLSLSLSPHAPHAQYRKRFRASCNFDTVKSHVFVRYPFSYLWLETGSGELISVLSRASKQNEIKFEGLKRKRNLHTV